MRAIPLSLVLLAALVGLVGCEVNAQTSNPVLTWTAPTTFTDGTVIGAAPVTYNVYQGVTGPASEGKSPVAAGVTAATFTATAVPGANMCWTVTALVAGIESAASAEVCQTFAPRVPSAPTNLTVKSAAGTVTATAKKATTVTK